MDVICHWCRQSFVYTGYDNHRWHKCDECKALSMEYGHLLPRKGYGLSQHNMTGYDYLKLLIAQDFRCAICKEPGKRLCVDHDHSCCDNESRYNESCGKCIRGLICHRCNTILGFYEKNRHLFPAFDEYLSAPKVLA